MPGYEVFGEEEQNAINELFKLNGGILFAHGFDALRNGIYRVREFESAVAKKFNIPYAQAVSSGSAALRVALEALELSPGDEVILPSFTYIATIEAVIQAGATPVIVDIDDSFNMSPPALRAAINEKTCAIIPVHMMGAPADMNEIVKIAQEYKLRIIEDAAQAVGAKYLGRYLGTIGDLGCFSFDAGKCIMTGEGGMVVTSSKDFYNKTRSYHDHGHEYLPSVGRGIDRAVRDGFNYRLTELQGAIGIVQLSKLEMILSAQRGNKEKLMKVLRDGGFPFKFRRILDSGELGDTLIFTMPDRATTKKFCTRMLDEKISTKNIPDSLRWHFAKHWNHIFEKYGWYAKSYEHQWQLSADILETSIAIPIMVKMDDMFIEELGHKLIKIALELQ
ncbi:WecE Predicted pyridoxal phosphate-dependent enzyme apparently involved in regulation of cell wall biogenesis [Burkholderiaceae bacterium]